MSCRKVLCVVTLFLLLLSVTVMSGCVDLPFSFFDKGKGRLVGCQWRRSDGSESIVFKGDMTGFVMSDKVDGDYTFTWAFDPDKQNRMIFTTSGGENKIVYYYFVGNNILVLRFNDDPAWAYEKICG